MPCAPVKIGGYTAIVCTRGQRNHRCSHPGCRNWMVVRCDAKLENNKTCDKPLCRKHADHPIKGVDVDYCADHPHGVITIKTNRQGSMDV